jgi:RHS repeat-associated protein
VVCGRGLTGRRWLHADERGSIVAISDGTGAATIVNKYDEYGIPRSTNASRFQYTGQTWLPEIGMYYYKARIYSPTLGRFMQTDPIRYGDGVHWYNYAGSDPVNATDPTGLSNTDTCGTEVGPISPSYGSCSGEIIVTAFVLQPSLDLNTGGLNGAFAQNALNGSGGVAGGTAALKSKKQPAAGPEKTQPRCAPSLSQLANSGKVTFRFSDINVSALGNSGDAFGVFTTSGGYSGTFHTSFDGIFIGGKGVGVSYGGGSSRSLATFSGVNYNLVGTLGPISISDNYGPNTGEYVGETNGGSTLGLVLGGTRSDTSLDTISCPR